MALGITFFLGLFFIIGIIIVKLQEDRELVEHHCVALAFGAMIALVIFDLVPEILEERASDSWWLMVILIVAGAAILKLLDHFIPEHHESHTEITEGNLVHVGVMSAIAISLHNIVEGMTVYSISTASISTGLSLAFGIGLHNIPMGMFIYSTIKKENKNRKNIILLASVMSTFIGGILMWSISHVLTESFIRTLLCVELGMVLYILVFELLPSAFEKDGRKSFLLYCAAGFLIVVASTFIGH